MRRILLIVIGVMVAAGAWAALRPLDPQDIASPDPNHAHADFAVWLHESRVDFSAAEFMSGTSDDAASHDEAHEYLHPYMHLHDGNGDVMHRHKPGLTIGDFFGSLPGISFQGDQFASPSTHDVTQSHPHAVRLFVNGVERSEGSAYIFEDLDQILITDVADDATLQKQLKQLTDDACLYSLRCPWRGKPPAENCIADPAIPCVVPEE